MGIMRSLAPFPLTNNCFLSLLMQFKDKETSSETRKPQFKNKEEYFELLDSFYSSGNRIKYRDDNTAEISIF